MVLVIWLLVVDGSPVIRDLLGSPTTFSTRTDYGWLRPGSGLTIVMSKALANWLFVGTTVNLALLLSLMPALTNFEGPFGWGPFFVLLLVLATYIPLWRFMLSKIDEAPGLSELGRSNWHTWIGFGHHFGILLFWWIVLRSWAKDAKQDGV